MHFASWRAFSAVRSRPVPPQRLPSVFGVDGGPGGRRGRSGLHSSRIGAGRRRLKPKPRLKLVSCQQCTFCAQHLSPERGCVPSGTLVPYGSTTKSLHRNASAMPCQSRCPAPCSRALQGQRVQKGGRHRRCPCRKDHREQQRPFCAAAGVPLASRHRLGAWWNTLTLQHQHQNQYQHQASADCSPLCASQLNSPLFPGFHISRAWPSARRCPKPCVHALPAPQSASQLKGTKGVGPSSLAKITEVMNVGLAPAAHRSLACSPTPSPRCASGASGWAAKLPAAPGAAGQGAQGQHA